MKVGDLYLIPLYSERLDESVDHLCMITEQGHEVVKAGGVVAEWAIFFVIAPYPSSEKSGREGEYITLHMTWILNYARPIESVE